MKPPDDSPDTLVWALSMLSWGKLTAADAVPVMKAAQAAAARISLEVMRIVSWRCLSKTPDLAPESSKKQLERRCFECAWPWYFQPF
jgi:hypothetical protein